MRDLAAGAIVVLIAGLAIIGYREVISVRARLNHVEAQVAVENEVAQRNYERASALKVRVDAVESSIRLRDDILSGRFRKR
jgi:hypothetical protein